MVGDEIIDNPDSPPAFNFEDFNLEDFLREEDNEEVLRYESNE